MAEADLHDTWTKGTCLISKPVGNTSNGDHRVSRHGNQHFHLSIATRQN